MSQRKTAVLKSVPHESKMDIGVERRDRKTLATRLSEALSDSYLLYLKTQNVHWNVVGPLFYSIHELTEKQYEDLALAIDDIAERIRAIGFMAPGSFRQFTQHSSIKEDDPELDAEHMIESLVIGNEKVAKRLREAVIEAERCDDVMTAGLLTDRIGQHEQNAWMLRSIISR